MILIPFSTKINEELINEKHTITFNTKLNITLVYINYSNITNIKMKCNTACMLVLRANNSAFIKINLFLIFLYFSEKHTVKLFYKSEKFLWLSYHVYVTDVITTLIWYFFYKIAILSPEVVFDTWWTCFCLIIPEIKGI